MTYTGRNKNRLVLQRLLQDIASELVREWLMKSVIHCNLCNSDYQLIFFSVDCALLLIDPVTNLKPYHF